LTLLTRRAPEFAPFHIKRLVFKKKSHLNSQAGSLTHASGIISDLAATNQGFLKGFLPVCGHPAPDFRAGRIDYAILLLIRCELHPALARRVMLFRNGPITSDE
jgi:hypothetical protein